MATGELAARVRLLEEALAECIDWIGQQDVIDDNRASETAWIQDGEVVVRSPQGDKYRSDSLREYIDSAFDLLARCERVLGPDALAKARARYQTRLRTAADVGWSDA